MRMVSICKCVGPNARLSICVSVPVSICLSIYPSIYSSIYLSIHTSVMTPLMRVQGVTSKEGFHAPIPSGAIFCPKILMTRFWKGVLREVRIDMRGVQRYARRDRAVGRRGWGCVCVCNTAEAQRWLERVCVRGGGIDLKRWEERERGRESYDGREIAYRWVTKMMRGR